MAPIVLFVYNRPEHTLQTLQALRKNELADQSTLYIFADGPKENSSKGDCEKINAVRQLIRKESWCKEVIIKEGEKNSGLANSIINGVTEILNKSGKIIVLEDDIETSPGFLSYMNQALSVYEAEPTVMHISGYMFPVKEKLPNTFFYNTCSCWGWGTWKRAWSKLQTDPVVLYDQLKQKNLLHQFNVEDSADFEFQLLENINNKKNTWAVKWYATMILNNGYALHPYPSLVNNIGHDNSGENCVVTDRYKWKELASHINVTQIPISESRQARKAMVKFYRQSKETFLSQLKKIIPPVIKKTIKNTIIKKERTKVLEQNKQLKDLKRIKILPRFTEFQSSILGSPLTMVDSASFVFMFEEIFFKEIYKFKSFSKSPLIIDCGANIGLSVLFFKREFPNCRIIAFEPDKQIFKILQKNINSFGFENIRLINKGVWEKEGTLFFKRDGSDGGRIEIENNKLEYKVEVVKLSDYLDEQIDFLKIDIEGAEISVLNECKEELKNVRNIFIEYHSFIHQEQKLNILLSVLKESGFRCYITNPGLHSANPYLEIKTYNGMDMQLNIYGVRNESSTY